MLTWLRATPKPSLTRATTQDNPRDSSFAATNSRVINEVDSGHSSKATLYPLVGDQVESLEK